MGVPTRVGLLPGAEERINELLDLGRAMSEEQRLRALLDEELLPVIERASTIDGLRQITGAAVLNDPQVHIPTSDNDEGSDAAALLSPATRRTALLRAGAGLAAFAGGASLAAPAMASGSHHHHHHDSARRVLNFIVTQEMFGVTFLTEAVRRAPGTPSAQFLPVLKAANTTEFDHVRALRKFGADPLTRRFWIPDAAFGGGGAGLFASIEAVETIELSM